MGATRPFFQIGDERFEIRGASMHIEVRHPEAARAMRIQSPYLCIDVQARPRRVTSAPESMDLWEPRAYAEALPLSALAISSLSDLDSFSTTMSGALYVFEHRTLITEGLSVRRRDGRRYLEWLGGAQAVPRRVAREPIRIVTPIEFGGITVYEGDVAAASALLARHFPLEGLTRQEPVIHSAGRRKYWLFGPWIERFVTTRFLPTIIPRSPPPGAAAPGFPAPGR